MFLSILIAGVHMCAYTVCVYVCVCRQCSSATGSLGYRGKWLKGLDRHGLFTHEMLERRRWREKKWRRAEVEHINMYV